MLKVEIAYYNTNDKLVLINIKVAKGTTVKEVLLSSNLFDNQAQLTNENINVGIFSQKVTLETPIQEECRIELYRPLLLTPMERRRLLAQRRKS